MTYRDPKTGLTFAERTKARAMATQHATAHPGTSFAEWDHAQRLKAGTISASAEESLSSQERLELADLRQRILSRQPYTQIPEKYARYVADIAPATAYDASAEARTHTGFVAAMEQWEKRGASLQAGATQDPLQHQPICMALRRAFGPHMSHQEICSMHKTPYGRTLGTSVCPQGPAPCAVEE